MMTIVLFFLSISLVNYAYGVHSKKIIGLVVMEAEKIFFLCVSFGKDVCKTCPSVFRSLIAANM